MYAVLVLTLLAQPPKKEPAKLDPFVAKAIEPSADDTPLRKLQKDRVRERSAAVAQLRDVIAAGRADGATQSDLVKLRVTLAENLAELMSEATDRVKCYEMRVDALKEYERFAKRNVEVGTVAPAVLHIAAAARIDAEIDLLKLKDTLKGEK